MLNDIRESEGNRREWIVEVLKDIDGMHTGYLHKGELVRCKECGHWDESVNGHINVGDHLCRRHLWWTKEGDFCSDAERKTDMECGGFVIKTADGQVIGPIGCEGCTETDCAWK